MDRAYNLALFVDESDYPHQFWRAVAAHYATLTRHAPSDAQLIDRWEKPPGTSQRSLTRNRAKYGLELVPHRPRYGQRPPWQVAAAPAEILDNLRDAQEVTLKPEDLRPVRVSYSEYFDNTTSTQYRVIVFADEDGNAIAYQPLQVH